MGELKLQNFYKYYIQRFLKNRQIRHLISKILSNKVFGDNEILKREFLNIFFLSHPYFQSKLLFYYKRYIWLTLIEKKLKPLDKMEILNVSINYLKLWILKFFSQKFPSKIDFISKFNSEDRKIIQKLIADLNKIFLFKSMLERKSVNITMEDYRFNNKFSLSILKTTLGFFAKRRLKLFNINYDISKKYNLKQTTNENNNNLLKLKIDEVRKNNYLTTAFLVIRLKLNNIFLTAIDYKGDTIYQCSGGFYNIKGQNRMNSNTISILTQRLAIELKKMHQIDKLVILYKSGLTNKLIKSTIHGLKLSDISVIGAIYAYNRPTTLMRKRKMRRV